MKRVSRSLVARPCDYRDCVEGDEQFADCDDDPRNGCEVDTSTDRDNCGGCGRQAKGSLRCCSSSFVGVNEGKVDAIDGSWQRGVRKLSVRRHPRWTTSDRRLRKQRVGRKELPARRGELLVLAGRNLRCGLDLHIEGLRGAASRYGRRDRQCCG
jgi:hypothetical protein